MESGTVSFVETLNLDALIEDQGEQAARRTAAEIQEQLCARVEENRGEVIETFAHEFLCVFPVADAALNAACQMQKTFRESAPGIVNLRIGLHHGPVGRTDEGIFGDSVNVASRVRDQAGPGAVLASQACIDSLHDQTREIVRPYDRVRVKGKQQPLKLHEVLWRPIDLNQTAIREGMIDTGYLRNLAASRLLLSFADQHLSIIPSMTPVTLGRDRECNISLPSGTASRLHARIEHRRGKFLLVDSSTNGTHLRRSDGSNAVLYREEGVLTGNGAFALGEPVAEDAATLVRFKCE